MRYVNQTLGPVVPLRVSCRRQKIKQDQRDLLFVDITGILLAKMRFYPVVALILKLPGVWLIVFSRDEVGTTLWSHICIVVIGVQDPVGSAL